MSKSPSQRDVKTLTIPTYSSIADFCDDMESCLRKEIAFLKKNGGKRIKIFDGKRVDVKNGRYIYSFVSDSALNIPDNTLVTLWSSSLDNDPAVVVNSEDFTIIIETDAYLGDVVPEIEFSVELWRLLSALIDRIDLIRDYPPPIVKNLVLNGKKQIGSRKTIATGQDAACKMSQKQPITFVWGPPGTGKTETLAKIALERLAQGNRVLMLSYSNVSVDGATWRVFNKDPKKSEGRIVRYGYPRDKELLRHEYLTSYNLTLKNHPDLQKERRKLIEERRRLSRDSRRYVEIGKELTRIKALMDAEEKRAVDNAEFVATTVSKAVVDKTIYDGSFDTVIFDEASMAYIPQIVFAASLANSRFICMGDFAQLPPIVQADSKNALNVDIFNYCGIAKAVESGVGHKWLCMLDCQYRMHPEIADFASQTMYEGLLKSGEEMAKQRNSIVRSAPFAGSALRLVDLSGMTSTCKKTADQSYVNVLSAMIAIGIAVNAAKKNEVGIITPYNAQARLLNGMARDVAEQVPDLHKITCATVHQFQGSEKDVIIYDAVECYTRKYLGTLLTSTVNNYANRLYNVAVTRAKGKIISIANVDYLESRRFSKSLVFRNMIDDLKDQKKVTSGRSVISALDGRIVASYTRETAADAFLEDLGKAKEEINIDVPGGTSGNLNWFKRLAKTLNDAKKRGVKVVVRATDKSAIPDVLVPLAIENTFIANPVAVIDRSLAWYGAPFSDFEFVTVGGPIPTLVKPILRFQGKHFARSLYGFLEMNRTIDESDQQVETADGAFYNSFAAYVAGEIECDECGGKMRLKKGKSGKFFLGCENYPECDHTQFLDKEIVNDYLSSKKGGVKLCPQHNVPLKAGKSKFGVYVRCTDVDVHYFKLDEI